MILRSTHLLQGLLFSICICCYLATPLGKMGRHIGAKYLEGLTDNLSANEPIKILRSTDRDIIIQIRRSPIAQSSIENLRGDKDVLDQSDDSMYNKHTKSKLKSDENHDRDINDSQFVGKDIVQDRMSRLSRQHSPLKSFESTENRFLDQNNNPQLEETDHKENVKDRISRVSMHKFPHNVNQFESKEFQLKDRSSHRSLEEKEHPKPHREGSRHGNTNPKKVLVDSREGTGVDVQTSFSNKRFKDEETNKNKMDSTEHNFSDNRRNREGFPLNLSSPSRGNKHDLEERSYNVSEHKSSMDGINLNMNGNSNFVGSEEEELVHKMQNTKNKETDSVNTPNPRKISFRTISFKRNDMAETENPGTPSKTSDIIQDVRNKVNEGKNKLLFDHKETLRNKIIKTRSPTLDSLQDLKRKFNIDHKRTSLLPGPSALLPRINAPRLQTFRAPPKVALPPVYAPPNGQYYSQQQPRPTEDPVLKAERTKAALQRMILFVNAMGKVDYYVSNAARNFVDLLTHHTHEYDETVRSRYSGKNQDNCEGEKDKRDNDDEHGDDKTGYVRIRTSKTKRRSHEHGERNERNNPRNRDGAYYTMSGEYGW